MRKIKISKFFFVFIILNKNYKRGEKLRFYSVLFILEIRIEWGVQGSPPLLSYDQSKLKVKELKIK